MMSPEMLKQIQLVSLREELLQVKKCQYSLLTFEITGTCLLIGLVMTAIADLPANDISFWHLLLFFLPIVTILPSTMIIFDKGITSSRISGYFRVQEESIMQGKKLANDNGWENNCQNFRDNMDSLKRPHDATHSMTQGPNNFYRMIFYTGLLLFLVCFFLAVVYADRSGWKCFTMNTFAYQIVILCLVIAAICFMFRWIYKKQVVQILDGKYSIKAMAILWRQIL